ncbi:hypothetical protein BDZ94DRAFT_1326887 [Collybia nuda]|uniref:Uncharacterized protein n=1 Tax=Collybia nuda TaxID=64659 RepID=A0A9P5XRW7_9AGAR|nr:hypothetical protein BDZ94DRAFT_1326887 [Collybia nuda]
MSARTPFIPVAKDLRAANTQEQTQNLNQSTANTIFSPDPSNPLHTSAVTAQPGAKSQSKAPENTHISQPVSSTGPGNSVSTNNAPKPLNLGGLIKKTNRSSQGQGPFQNQGPPHRPSLGNLTVRPGTADPHTKSQQNQENHRQTHIPSVDIIAPIPRQVIRAPSPLLSIVQASGIISSSKFKTPSLPQSISTKKPNDAHTSTSALGFSFSQTKAIPDQQHTCQLPSPPTSIRLSSTRTLESHPVIDLDQEVTPFFLNTSLPNQTGPQRVLINDGNRRNINHEQASHRGNQLKRPRNDQEQAEEDLATSAVKRYKDLSGEYNTRLPGVSSPVLPSSPSDHFRSQYRPSRSRSPEVMDNTSQSHHHGGAPLTPSGHEHVYQHDDPDSFMVDGPRALDKLLGRDTDTYIEENMEKYERATDRWRDCAMEDWIAGATELTARYGKLLDFVKIHMTFVDSFFVYYAVFARVAKKHGSSLLLAPK